MTLNDCLHLYSSGYTKTFITHLSNIPYTLSMTNRTGFLQLDWLITIKRESPMGDIRDMEVKDIYVLQQLTNWRKQ